MKLKSLLLGIVLCLMFSAFGFSDVNALYSVEMQEAYYWALSKSVTTLSPIDAADLDGVITRQAMAKMISNFSINVLKKEPDTTQECRFTDNDIAEGLLPHIITSCQLGLMGQGISQFNPYSVVTRAEFGTILSRALWGDKYDKGKRHTYYERHLKALKEEGIMNLIDDPAKIEIRGYVFLMLMRTANYFKAHQTTKPAKTTTGSVVPYSGMVLTGDNLTGVNFSGSNRTGDSILGSGVEVPMSGNLLSGDLLSGSALSGFNLTGGVESGSQENLEGGPVIQTLSGGQMVVKKSEYTYKEESWWFSSLGGEKFYGILYHPDREDKMPIVIYSPGLGTNYEAGIPYAESLAKSGVAVLLFDFRGGATTSKSEGETTKMSIMTEKDDLETVLKEVQKWDFIDKTKIVLWGSSQGGVVSALVASKRSDIAGTILFYPDFSIPDKIKAMFSSIDDIDDTFDFMGMLVGYQYAMDIWDLDIYSEIAKDKKPVLIIHGTSDPIVHLSYSEKAADTYLNASLQEIQGGGHGFDGIHMESALRYVRYFLEELLVL